METIIKICDAEMLLAATKVIVEELSLAQKIVSSLT